MRPLHETLRAARLAKGWTVEQVFLALQRHTWRQVAPPSYAVVGHWLNGTRRPRHMEHLRALCDVLDVSISDVYGEGPQIAATDIEAALLAAAREADDEDVQLALALLQRARKRKPAA